MLARRKIEWIFFDLGSTLIDETECVERRFAETLAQSGAPDRQQFLRVVDRLAAENREAYYLACEYFSIAPKSWDNSLEVLYPGVPELLSMLSKKYKLGVIANQAAGTVDRLRAFGIYEYFDVVISSAEEGVIKPSAEIFLLALKRSGAAAEASVMVGDRLDNDIRPSAALGFMTVWVKQGYGALGNPDFLEHKPDYTLDSVVEIIDIF